MNKPNLLYITHGSNDFTDDFMFMGLAKYVDYFNIYYAISDSAAGHPKTAEERAENISYGWKDTWLKAAKMFQPVDMDIKYDLCVVGQIWMQNQERFFELKELIKPMAPIVLIEGLDDCHPFIPCLVPATHYYRNNDMHGNYSNIFMPFSCPYEIAEQDNFEEPEYLINCQLGLTHQARVPTMRAVSEFVYGHNLANHCLLSMWHGGNLVAGHSPRTPLDKYWDVLNKSKIIIHERGAGYDAFRFWEGIATGNIVLCTPENCFVVNQLPLPPNVIIWENHNDLKDLLWKLVQVSTEELMLLRKEAKNHVRTHHMPHNRWEKIFRHTGFSIISH